MENIQWRECLANSIRYREPRRIAYNLLLAVIVILHFASRAWSRGLESGS